MVKALLQTVRLLWNMSTYDMTCVCLFQMCCSTNYCIHTHSGLWSLLSPSPLWTTCPSAQWFRSASQIWAAFTGIVCRNNFIHWWLTMIFLPPFSIHFIKITFPSQVVEDVTPILYTSPEPKVGLTKYLKDSSSKWPFTSLFLFLGY